MKTSDEEKKNLATLRKIERHAKQLLYKMQRLETEWKKVRAEIKGTSESLPKTLGDVLSKWNRG